MSCPVQPGKIKGNDRISTWVTSKGAFYQNSVVLGDGKVGHCQAKAQASLLAKAACQYCARASVMLIRTVASVEPSCTDILGCFCRCSAQQADEDGDNGSMGSSECPEEEDGVGDFAAPAAAAHRASGPGALKGALAAGGAAAAAGKLGGDGGGGGNYADDDAGSEGGQSAISAQSSSGGAEYKRGKRFRKLVKLMDSGQAQQVRVCVRVCIGGGQLQGTKHIIAAVSRDRIAQGPALSFHPSLLALACYLLAGAAAFPHARAHHRGFARHCARGVLHADGGQHPGAAQQHAAAGLQRRAADVPAPGEWMECTGGCACLSPTCVRGL